MESDVNVDDQSSHENELWAETWFFKIIARLDYDRTFQMS